MNVTRTLLRVHRKIALWIAAIAVVIASVGLVLVTQAGPMRYSFWLVIAGSIAKYWTLTVGIMMISMHFRTFVGNGVTRREFLVAVAGAGLMIAAGFAIAVTAGHALESAVLGLTDQRGPGYPSVVDGDLGRVFPVSLGYFTSGVLIAAGFHRFRPWIGVALIIPGAVPVAVADGLLGFNERGEQADRLAYLPALAISLVVTAAAAAAIWALMWDVPVRRAAG